MYIDATGIRAYDGSGNLIFFLPTNGTALEVPVMVASNGDHNAFLDLEGTNTGYGGTATLGIDNQNGEFANFIFDTGDFSVAGRGQLVTPDQFQFGKLAPLGGYYDEEVTTDPTQSIPNNAGTFLTNLSSVTYNSDYNNVFNYATGNWTCPVTGSYVITHSIRFPTAAAYAQLARVIISGPGTIIGSLNATTTLNSTQPMTLTFVKSLTAGQVLRFETLQASGAAQLMAADSYIHIHRML